MQVLSWAEDVANSIAPSIRETDEARKKESREVGRFYYYYLFYYYYFYFNNVCSARLGLPPACPSLSLEWVSSGR